MASDVIQLGAMSVRFLVEAGESGGSVAMFEITIPADARVPAPHSHDGYEETIYGLAGTSTWTVEGEATELRTYESYLIPGLLQTEAYARSAVEAERPTLAPADVDKAVAIRMTRQELFDRERPPRAWFIIDESALFRTAASPATMRGQCEHLLAMGQRPAITIQVIESAQGICCAFRPGVRATEACP